ncbi:Uncharacterized protein OS=Planctomyces maris DSM 8797 GN=PM8797T_14921 PE=4 SV=1 [Gemmata massiliana]|uniref:Carboxypeptidase regulatory-like domain-containing protein n=1 Tax=Gemmata massiliana TaxID=1210884 RepID=A0A6P2CUL1_9BACT|nr:hypothetical protein [Gemmata massiliana]VTR90792.1 Uncharacterized protein OS=Planctomyces maris DSM 8797 GN=PM8797T_14921 PE=4 SV=1 [Gemmata massiliana]
MSQVSYALRAAALVGALVVLTGCGGRGAVEGTVTFNGEPVDNGGINFVAEDGKSTGAGGEIKDGKYTITGDRAPAPGKYKVQIVWNKKTGRVITDTADTGAKVNETRQVIPEQFNTQTTLTAEIKSGANTGVNFDLKGTPGTRPSGKAVGD